MNEIKPPAVAGIFYPENQLELNKMISNFDKTSDFETRAVIAPHAGYIYSGALAMKSISHLKKDIKTIFIFAPAHKLYFRGLALSSYKYWQTPLGKIELDNEIYNDIKLNFNAAINDEALREEHALEVQLPLIQTLFKNIKIVPVLIGAMGNIEGIIEKYYHNNSCGFIFSSDLSHFLNYDEAKKVDLDTANLIETNNMDNFASDRACGAAGIIGLCKFCKEKNYSLIRIGMLNSKNITNNKNSTVGYGAWGLFEGRTSAFIEKYYSNFIINLCKKNIENFLLNKKTEETYPAVFNQQGASFVTIEKEGHLRGCIGSIIAHRTLINDLISNSISAAFYDPRFKPIRIEELSKLKISVSILSPPAQINFSSEDDLLSKIQQGIDGIIIKDKNHQAVYLPSVWEQLPDKKLFLNSLKQKAGLPLDYFSETFEAYRFKTTYIKENP